MFYIPLCTAAETHALPDVKANGGADGSLKKSPDTPSGSIATASRTTAKRLDGTQEEGADAEMSGGTTANTTAAGTRREAPGARGATRRNCRETRAAPTAAVDCGVAPPAEPLGAKGNAKGAVSRTAAGGGADDTECLCGAAHGARWITPTNDFLPEQHQRIRERGERVVSRPVASTSADAASCGRFDDDDTIPLRAEADTTMISRCFRNPSGLPWQRYVRIPIGGAFTSVVVLGAPNSRSLVLTGFYPAPNIGFCKVNHLLPPDAFFPLLGALALPLTAQPEAAEPLPRGQYATAAHARSDAPPPPPPPTSSRATAADTPLGVTTAAVAIASSPMPPLDPGLQDEATAAVNHWHQEREWSHHHRREIREMVRSAAHAATMRHPRNPQTAGEEHKWSLSPVPEVRVVSRNSHSFLRVSWKVQTLNAKVIVGIE
ncbi:hypothetical protein JKF63_05581 [Porcisia hertigi]|uniref:Uncharacterized protein n=1 Tax=Porcisia hertigi TaxID=2761500 RepID=A0A836HPC2_9TRYP|nr:hypothetical protein JKF63_05581 [Porcisia hertigi]